MGSEPRRLKCSSPWNPEISHRLRAIENRVLRRIFVSKRQEMVGGWRI
jgi:hypothetical protein